MELGGCRWNTPCQLTACGLPLPLGRAALGQGGRGVALRGGVGAACSVHQPLGSRPPAWQSLRTCLIPDREVRVVEGEAWQTST